VIRDFAAKRYAEAAYLIAREDGSEETWSEGLAAMAKLFGDDQAQAFLENSRVPPADKARLVDSALAGTSPLVLNLARLLLRRGKAALAPQIREAFQELLDEAKGISHATVTSAVPLTADDMKAVTQRLSDIAGGAVVIDTRVDGAILGGLVVRIGDRLIDGSTKSKLIALKRQLAGAGS
jgi:F-type H+-transporting ATPase subunit delta